MNLGKSLKHTAPDCKQLIVWILGVCRTGANPPKIKHIALYTQPSKRRVIKKGLYDAGWGIQGMTFYDSIGSQ